MKMSLPRWALVVGLASSILTANLCCAAQPSTRAQEKSLLEAARNANDRDDISRVLALEWKALEAVDADADRQGDRLTLHLFAGATKNYENRPECKALEQSSKCVRYSLIAHAQSCGVFVVLRLYYESAEYLLVNDTSGEETILRSFPIFSPSCDHVLALLMNDQELGFAIQIWRRAARRFILEWSGSPHADAMYTTYKLLGWPSESVIELQAQMSFAPPAPQVKKQFILHLYSDGWKVMETH